MGLKFLSVCCVMEELPCSFSYLILLKMIFRCFSLRFLIFQILCFQQPYQLQSGLNGRNSNKILWWDGRLHYLTKQGFVVRCGNLWAPNFCFLNNYFKGIQYLHTEGDPVIFIYGYIWLKCAVSLNGECIQRVMRICMMETEIIPSYVKIHFSIIFYNKWFFHYSLRKRLYILDMCPMLTFSCNGKYLLNLYKLQ